VSKPNNVRKKALDFAKKRQWEKALEEFTRLVEIEQHNPNLFNEIGDIHLKMGNKREAFKQYHEAIDAYAKVGLHNNAVAVCKKILRLNPNDDVVYGKMATLRQRQGFGHEAVAYSVTFLDRVLEIADLSGESLQALVVEISGMREATPEVLERAVQFLLRCEANSEAGSILERLEKYYTAHGMAAERDRVRKAMSSIDYVPASAEAAPAEPQKLDTVESHGQHAASEPAAPFGGVVPPHIRRGHDQDAAEDFGLVDVEKSKKTTPANSASEVKPALSSASHPSTTTGGKTSFSTDPSVVEIDRSPHARSKSPEAPSASDAYREEDSSAGDKEYVIPEEGIDDTPKQDFKDLFADDASDGAEAGCADGITGRSASDVKADVEEDDHRSHYDLGMAYLEMGLFAEAVREFQIAANLPIYRVRSLEMIGCCFINQNQPKLAIKQLVKGLELVENDDRTALGIKYSLALAYEMTGEIEKAKAMFEDVYVVDISFRDVQEKVRKYAS
jgi:tetratricopeptide (TPR) repeat protein